MARQNVKGTKQLNRELPAELVDAFTAFCKDHGVKVAAELALAIRRHMAFPPDRSAFPPLPARAETPADPEPLPARAKKRQA